MIYISICTSKSLCRQHCVHELIHRNRSLVLNNEATMYVTQVLLTITLNIILDTDNEWKHGCSSL